MAGAAVAVVIAARSEEPELTGTTLAAGVRGPVAMAPLAEGGLIFGERTSGRVQLVDPEDRLQLDPVARVEVSSADGGGLLGLTVDVGEQIYASYTNVDGRLEVARLEGSRAHVIWEGPAAGAAPIAFAPDERLVVALNSGGANPGGEIIALDPELGPSQEPQLVSPGWGLILTMTYDDTGRLWVGEDGGNEESDRVGLATPDGPARVGEFPPDTNPSGIAIARSGTLAVCSPITHELTLHDATSTGSPRSTGELVASDCEQGVVAMSDGRLAYAATTAIRTIRP